MKNKKFKVELLGMLISMYLSRNVIDEDTLKKILKHEFGSKVRYRVFLKILKDRKRKLQIELKELNNLENLTSVGLVQKSMKFGGFHALYKFGTDGISLIRHQFSYGGKEGFFEKIDVKYDSKDDDNLSYNILNSTVEGWLTVEEVNKIILEKMERYNSRTTGSI